MNPIHILKTGHYTDMYGRHYQFSEADLNDIMQTYDPTLHEAPIVVGHPRSDGPAYGWVGGVKRGNDGLSVEPRDVEPQFAELVKTRRYSKVSACLYGPDTPGNPTPGKYYLRHVGFLGAQPPAIKGLKPVTFADAGEDLIELSEWSQQTTASLFSRIRDFIISQFGLEKANSVVPDYMIDSLRDDASRTPASPASAFSDPAGSPAEDVIQPTPEHQAPTPPEDTAVDKELQAKLQKENDDLKRQIEERNKADAQRATAERHNANVAFAEGLINDPQPRLAPAAKDKVVAILDALDAPDNSGHPPTFSEGETTQTLAETFRSLLKQGNPVICFGEVATVDKAALSSIPAEFAEADPARLEMHTKAVALMKAENITYEAAVRRLI
ncbi:peptidase [Salmonella enterica subsp. diarizonae]|nr:peptidase [Salmonella enterica subsp. diarizonae]EDE1925312.1 peptidase [Salmonella enterica subsp. diarizonae]EDJ8984728.1 peptidase [Salmonella enterica subsp. diarizonae]